jgi:transitional endoplasmic reticulum ATPase
MGSLDALIKKLEKQPHNLTLRLAVMRRAQAEAMNSRALELALDLDPETVTNPDDRALVARIFDLAGLADDAAEWRVDAPGPSAPETPTQERVLRVVGGSEDTGASVALPDRDDGALTFADVGGLDSVKKDIERRIITPFRQAGLLSRFKKRSGGGVLLYGPPGCGKTLLARATAGECGFDFVSVSIADVLSAPVGSSERRLTALFERARAHKPAVLFFDEIDALGSRRTTTSATHQAQLVSHFLTELDGIDNRNDGILILAATNIPWAIDPAFLRPGRFDRMFFVPPPDRIAREAILALELGTRPSTASPRLDKIAAATSGLSGADLALIVEQAADDAIDATLAQGHEVPINHTMLARATKVVRSSITDWLTTAHNHATYANESGRYDDILAFLKDHGRG